MVTLENVFKITAARRQSEPDPKEEWWDSLPLQAQKLYKEQHPKSAKHLTTHDSKHKHHSQEAAHHEEVYKFNIAKHEKSKNPEQKRKLEGKIDAAEENMLIHRAKADDHKKKMEESYDGETPFYGDEEGLEEEEVENPEESENEENPIQEHRKGIHDTIQDSIEKDHKHTKVDNALKKFTKVFTNPKHTNTIVKKVSDMLGEDVEAQKALKEAEKYADKKVKPPKHILKQLAKVATIGLAVGLSVAVAGALPTIMIAASIKASSHSGGLLDLAWDAFKKGREERKNKPTKEELEKNHVHDMIEGLRKELKSTEDEDREEMLESLIATLKEALYKHFPEDEEPDYRSLKHRRKKKSA